MSAETMQVQPSVFARWLRATTLGWLLGFVLVVVLALAWGMIGGEAQFMVGVGMGAGVGYVQTRVVREWVESTRRWLLASIIGMGVPFLLWDLGALIGIEAFFSLPLCVVAGGLLVGILQCSLLRLRLDRASFWIPACVVGWGLPAGAIALGDSGLFPAPGFLLSLGAMFFGGVVLGAVTGKALMWMPRRSAA
ncbi:MAG: hypothetical protein IH966_03375 [Gemmatimonadetes bacterium]|nr:hypothetical protein [Gemmatimonadota bacterium]